MKLAVYQAARELIVVVERGAIRDAELRDQATRAAKSVLLRLAEGLPLKSPAMRQKFFSEAWGSLHEVAAAVDVAAAIGALDAAVAEQALDLAGQTRRLLSGLRR